MINLNLGSPNSIIWTYFRILTNSSNKISSIENEKEKKETIFITIIIAITVIEAFINIYFTLLIESEKYSSHRKKILYDLQKRISLDRKVKTWPKLLFKKNIDFYKGAGKEFKELKIIRNKLVHFIADYKNRDVGNIRINKLIDISEYEKLNEDYAKNIPEVVLDFTSEIFLLSGCKKENIPHQIHLWFGDLSRIKSN